MIVGVFGLPRSGKSTLLAYCAERALRHKALACGRGAWRVSLGDFSPYDKVYSTFPILSKSGKVCKLDCFQLGKIEIKNSLLLIDEISLVFDSRDYKAFPKHCKEFFALHGHWSNDIIYASQGFEDCDKRIRNMTDTLLYVDRAGRFSRVRPIRKQWSIDGSIVEGYTLCPRYRQNGCTDLNIMICLIPLASLNCPLFFLKHGANVPRGTIQAQ